MVKRAQDTGGKDRRRYQLVSAELENVETPEPAFRRLLEFLHCGTDFLTVPPRVDQAEAHGLYQGMASAVPWEAVNSGL